MVGRLSMRLRRAGWLDASSKTTTCFVSARAAEAHAVSPEPSPMTATSSGEGWETAASAPIAVWSQP